MPLFRFLSRMRNVFAGAFSIVKRCANCISGSTRGRKNLEQIQSIECLFCRGKGPFTTVEHIVPKSLGNDSDILKGVVCDKCQNYFGKAIEKEALENTPFAFWRTFICIPTGRKKLPSVSLNPPDKGVLPSNHAHSDVGLGFTAHEDLSVSVDIDDPAIIKKIMSGEKTSFDVVLSPWHLSIMGRFLGKMGLEYAALSDYELAMSEPFDEIRAYIREGSKSHLWPIFWGKQGSVKEIRGDMVEIGGHLEEKVEYYRYSLGETKRGEYVFAFGMGTDLTMICLSHRLPDPWLTRVIEEVDMDCVWYADNSW